MKLGTAFFVSSVLKMAQKTVFKKNDILISTQRVRWAQKAHNKIISILNSQNWNPEKPLSAGGSAQPILRGRLILRETIAQKSHTKKRSDFYTILKTTLKYDGPLPHLDSFFLRKAASGFFSYNHLVLSSWMGCQWGVKGLRGLPGSTRDGKVGRTKPQGRDSKGACKQREEKPPNNNTKHTKSWNWI